MLQITLVLFIVGEAVAQIGSGLPCPVLQTVSKLNLTAYSGKWYEFSKYNVESRITDKCVTDTYIPYRDGTFMIIRARTPMDGSETHNTEYKATPVNDPKNGKFKLGTGEPYDVLGTDHVNWAITWTCRNTRTGSTRDARILTRKINPLKPVIDFVDAVVKVKKIHIHRFIKTIKTGCPRAYYKHGN